MPLTHTEAAGVIEVARSELERRSMGAAIAVVDAHGELMAFLRTDGCRLPSITIAINKAFTAAREQIETAELGRRSREEGFPMTNFGDARYVSWGGGVPLLRNGETIGAIGVSGLPEHEDIEIARRSAASIG
ncbi:MAG TPA: heme-binding protein, partial [Acidimicrobiia bacterium]